MNVFRATQNAIWPRRAEFHVLTYAEEGFSPLNIHTRGSSLSKDQLVAFAAQVNAHKETGSLYPVAAVSAVPRTLIRDSQDTYELRKYIEDFFRTNAQSIGSKKVLIDFRTPQVQKFVITAIESALTCLEASFIDELAVIDDTAI